MKGFTYARLSCGCRVGFRRGVEGSPVTVVVDDKGPGCRMIFHVCDMPIFDHRGGTSTVDPSCLKRRGELRRRGLVSVSVSIGDCS